jgi:hypothetical protein
MKRFIPVVVLLFVSACSQQDEKVYTVDALINDDARLTKIISECRDNPGEVRNTPNCLNAEAADGKSRLERMRTALGG